MKKLLFAFVLILFGRNVSAQSTDSLFRDSMANYEYQLQGLSDKILNGEDEDERMTSTYYFIQKLKMVLKIKGSFNYPFDSLKTISILKSKDNDFRIFTWNLILDNGEHKYFGAIQKNNPDSLELYGLYDYGDKLEDIQKKQVDNRKWVGCLYYYMHQYTYKKKKYAVLLGWDGHTQASNKKIMDVLTFDEQGKPVFGAPIFKGSEGKDAEVLHRVVFEFSNQASMMLRYEKSKNLFSFDHLVPPDPKGEGIYATYLPDGSYDFFQFKKGYWVRREDLFTKVKGLKMEGVPNTDPKEDKEKLKKKSGLKAEPPVDKKRMNK